MKLISNIKFITFLCSTVTLLLIVVYTKILNIEIPSIRIEIWNDNELNTRSCSPILENRTQFYVEIDGQRYPKLVPSFFNRSINFECLNKNPRSKLFLLWNDYGPWNDWKYGLGKYTPFQKRKCPVYNCEITKDRNRLDESDLVVIHMRGNYAVLPNRTSIGEKKARWVFLMSESPIYSGSFKHLNGKFNLSATYKINSDFSSFFYSNIEFDWELNEDFDENKDYLGNKTKFAAILVTHCDAHSKRINYVKEMQKYEKGVEIYGGCGISCKIPGENRFLSNECRKRISSQYMFFLAFENSICKDYITEKLFDTLMFDIIPVVLGGGPYDHWVPKSAYINALDFESPKHLVEYLQYLSKNATAYNSYFKWKKYIKYTNNQYKAFCDMCIKLNLEDHFGVKESVVEDFDDYWNVRKDCLAPSIDKNGVFKYLPIKK